MYCTSVTATRRCRRQENTFWNATGIGDRALCSNASPFCAARCCRRCRRRGKETRVATHETDAPRGPQRSHPGGSGEMNGPARAWGPVRGLADRRAGVLASDFRKNRLPGASHARSRPLLRAAVVSYSASAIAANRFRRSCGLAVGCSSLASGCRVATSAHITSRSPSA
jgi:hypothetical protein